MIIPPVTVFTNNCEGNRSENCSYVWNIYNHTRPGDFHKTALPGVAITCRTLTSIQDTHYTAHCTVLHWTAPHLYGVDQFCHLGTCPCTDNRTYRKLLTANSNLCFTTLHIWLCSMNTAYCLLHTANCSLRSAHYLLQTWPYTLHTSCSQRQIRKL